MTMKARWAMPVLAIAAGVTVAASGAAMAAGTAGTPAASPLGPAPGMSRAAARPSVAGRFYSVAATSSRNVWAVGLHASSALIMRWSGSRSQVYRWRVSFTESSGYFLGVAATSADNAWAVGGTNWFSPSQTLAEHWNGKTWTQVPTPTPSGGGVFNAVAATSASNAWAVGSVGPGPGIPSVTLPLIEHWNGTAWTQQQFAEPADGGQFTAVAATGPGNAWAVGHTGATSEGTGQTTLIEHWNGKRWKRVPSPNPPGSANGLAGVAVTGTGDAWADGDTFGTTDSPLIEHWNGKHWVVVPSPNPTGDTGLQAIAAASPDDAWAVGVTNPNSCSPHCATVAFHWNGKRWTVTASVNPPHSYLDVFEGVTIISARNVWAVGAYDGWSSTLIEHWNGKGWIWHSPR